MRQERGAFEQKAKELQAKSTEARRAKSAADGAVASAAELIRQIDSRRDLTAQYVGELQEAYTRLQQQVTALSTEKPAGESVPYRFAHFKERSTGRYRVESLAPLGSPRTGWAERRSGTASRSRRTRIRRFGRFTVDQWDMPVLSPDSERWSSWTTAATAILSTAISLRRPFSRATPWRPVQRWERSVWLQPAPDALLRDANRRSFGESRTMAKATVRAPGRST